MTEGALSGFSLGLGADVGSEPVPPPMLAAQRRFGADSRVVAEPLLSGLPIVVGRRIAGGLPGPVRAGICVFGDLGIVPFHLGRRCAEAAC